MRVLFAEVSSLIGKFVCLANAKESFYAPPRAMMRRWKRNTQRAAIECRKALLVYAVIKITAGGYTARRRTHSQRVRGKIRYDLATCCVR